MLIKYYVVKTRYRFTSDGRNLKNNILHLYFSYNSFLFLNNNNTGNHSGIIILPNIFLTFFKNIVKLKAIFTV